MTDAQLDYLGEIVEEAMISGNVAAIDGIIRSADPRNTDEALALLTYTLPIRSKLSDRAEFYETVESLTGPELLKGLK